MLIDKVVVMKWNSKNIKYYESYGKNNNMLEQLFIFLEYDKDIC